MTKSAVLAGLLLATGVALVTVSLIPVDSTGFRLTYYEKPRAPGLEKVATRKVHCTPKVPDMPIAPNLSNVQGLDLFEKNLSERDRALLASNGFVISGSEMNEFWEAYGYRSNSAFVTADSLFHVYHVLLYNTLKEAERLYLAARLSDLLEHARAWAQTIHAEAPAALKPAAEDTIVYFSTAQRLLHPGYPIPSAVRERVLAEVEPIEGAEQVGGDTGDSEDYTKYAPVAGYEGDEKTESYFRATRFLATHPLRFGSIRETQTCLLAALAVTSDSKARDAYEDIRQFRELLCGQPDDLTPLDIIGAAERVFGRNASPADLADPAKASALQAEFKKLRQPQTADQLLTEPGADPLTGWGLRPLSPGLTIRGEAFQKLAEERVMGSGTHMAWLLGSAAGIPEKDATLLKDLRDSFQKRCSAPGNETDIYSASLAVLSSLSAPHGEGYPGFMRNAAWQTKTVNTQMAAWSEIEHDVVAYAKDNTMYYGDMGDEEPQFHGYVEPVPQFYADLATLVARTRSAFAQFGIFDLIQPGTVRVERGRPMPLPSIKDFENLEKLLQQLQEMAEKELENRTFDAAEIEVLDGIGETLKDLVLDFSNGDKSKLPMSVVAPLVREYASGEARYFGVGRPLQIIAVVPYAGRLHCAKGAVYSYYEFRRPLDQPLNDAEWKDLTLPPLWLQPYKPWIMEKNLGVDTVAMSAQDFRAWLSALDSQSTDRGESARRWLLTPYGLRKLNEMPPAKLDSEAVALARQAFAAEAHNGDVRLALCSVLLRSDPNESRLAGIQALDKVRELAAVKSERLWSDYYQSWIYLSLRLLDASSDQPETRNAITALREALERRANEDGYSEDRSALYLWAFTTAPTPIGAQAP